MIEKFLNLNKTIQTGILIILFIVGWSIAFNKSLFLALIPFSIFVFLNFKRGGKDDLIKSIAGVAMFIVFYSMLLSLKKSYHFSGLEGVLIFFSWILVVIIGIALKSGYLDKDTADAVLGREYIDDIENVSSFPNMKDQEGGYKFSTIKEIKDFSSTGVLVDNFNYYPLTEKYVKNKKHLDEVKEIKINVKPINFTRTFMVLGAMGSGKTEFFHSIINQKGFNRKLIHDIKGDFVEKWYDSEKDFIFNPYDTRGVNWDIWEELNENTALVESFIGNLMESQAEEKDFFTSSAKRVIIDFFMKVNYTKNDATSEEKWGYLNDEIENYRKEADSDKTKGSIYQTMELVIELFTYMAWHSKQNKKSFTVKQFLEGNGTLYLLNNSSVSTKLTPLFTGFISLFTEILLSQADTKDDLTLMLLDEYLSMNFEKQTRLKLLTQVRSKGGCLMLGLQFLPKHDKEHQQLLDSSAYGKLIFQLNDSETVTHIINSISDITYVAYTEGHSSNSSSSGGIPNSSSGGWSTNYSEKNKKLITTEHLQSMPKYSHLSIFSSDKILYLGYTYPVENLSAKNKNFILLKQDDYYKSKYNTGKNISTKEELDHVEEEIKKLEQELSI